MKTFLIGTVENVQPIEQKTNFKLQRFDVVIKEFERDSGQPLPDQVFPVTLFNKKIESFFLDNKVGKRVKVDCYLKSMPQESQGKVFHNIALNGHSITVL